MKAYVTGQDIDWSLFQAHGWDVYDWTSPAHQTASFEQQDERIRACLDSCDVFILTIGDPDYEYGASRLQFGYALLKGTPCIVYDPNVPYARADVTDERHCRVPRLLRNLYDRRLERPSNLVVCTSKEALTEALEQRCQAVKAASSSSSSSS